MATDTRNLTIRPFIGRDRLALETLWGHVFANDPPWNRPGSLIDRKLNVDPELLLVAILDGRLVGAVMAGFDDVRGWIYHLAVEPAYRRRGIATRLVRAAEAALLARGCPKVNLQVRATNEDVVAFYRALEYDVEERVSMGRLLGAPDSSREQVDNALRWIVDLLRRLGVPFQAVGGLAARAYGATRPLVDLDFYIPTERLADVATAAAPYVVRPPAHSRDESWDLSFMKVEYAGCKIELGGAESARYFDRRAECWRAAGIDFARSIDLMISGVRTPTMPREQLIEYKQRLDRDVDRQDVAEMNIAPN